MFRYGTADLSPCACHRSGILTPRRAQSESVLIQKIYTHFKKAPGTHKLGVLYVVDSVTRKWLDHAKANGQTINSSAQDGTFAAGVHRVTELMPVLMNDIIQAAPEDQKVRLHHEPASPFAPQRIPRPSKLSHYHHHGR